jgi:transcriptional regulator with XRE-family HTH domain
MASIGGHWTNKSIEDFLYRVGSDYIVQIEHAMDERGINQSALAQQLDVTEGRVSQVLNNPGNLTLKKIIAYARALRKKVAIIAYDDDDPDNHKGPVNSEIFVKCWEKAGRPSDFFELNQPENTGMAKYGSYRFEQSVDAGKWIPLKKDMTVAQSTESATPIVGRLLAANTGGATHA